MENYDHDRYPVELGLPVWLAHLEDCIFEGLPKTKAKTWPERFLQAIPVGVDTDIVLHKLAIRRMNRLITLQQKALAKDNPDEIKSVINQAIAAIEMVKKCHEAEIGIWVCEVNFEAASRSAAFEQEAEDLLELLAALKKE